MLKHRNKLKLINSDLGFVAVYAINDLHVSLLLQYNEAGRPCGDDCLLMLLSFVPVQGSFAKALTEDELLLLLEPFESTEHLEL